MKRGAGYLAFFAVLMAGLRFAGVPASLKETPGVLAQAGVPPVPAAFLREETTCHAFDYPAEKTETHDTSIHGPDAGDNSKPKYGEIARLIDQFFFGSTRAGRPSAGKLPAGIRLLIATVPDPRHTHLSLQFDRALEAIQQAAQDEGYIYDSSWLPWKAERVAYSSLNDRNAEMKEAGERELCPGLLAFRRSTSLTPPADCNVAAGALDVPYQCGLLVFVVGEKPTEGLNRVQWENALAWIDRHAGNDRADTTLRVLGPNFSGSMPSFVRAVKNLESHRVGDQKDPAASKGSSPTFSSTMLYSGRISGCRSWRWLQAQLPPTDSGSNPVRLADFEQNDALQTDRLYRYLVDRGQRLKEVAILSEDETAYGGLPDAKQTRPEMVDTSCDPGYHNSDRPVHLYYPRDISALRSAYEEQSIFSPVQKSDLGGGEAHTVLRPEAKGGPEEATDSITPFSGNNIALSEEAQLYGIVNALKTHGIRYIVLRSTNSLDFLFLTRFMHRAYPNAYIITMGSDLLFGREVDSTEFRGVVALSSYPLLPRGQDWTRQIGNVQQHAHRVFGANIMEGTYLACRYLMTDKLEKTEKTGPGWQFTRTAKADIPDYALPFWESGHATPQGENHAATWLGVIGHDGYWPLATLKDTLQQERPKPNIEAVPRAAEHPSSKPEDNVPGQNLDLTGSWRFVCVLALVIFGVHAFAGRYGWDRPDLSMFVQFTPLGGGRASGLLAAGWTAVCCILLVLFLTSARLYAVMSDADRYWTVIMGGATALAIGYAIIEVFWSNVPVQRHGEGRRRFKREYVRDFLTVGICMVAAIAAFGLVGRSILAFKGGSDDGLMAAYRSIHLNSGVSPVLPLIALLGGFYWWFWQELSGLALLSHGRPLLPRRSWEREKGQPRNDLARKIEQAAIPFPKVEKNTLVLYLLPLILVLTVSFVLQKAWMRAFDMILHSLENTAYNRTLHVLVGILLYLVFLECLQFYSTWLVLNRLLKWLDRLPLRRTFAALSGLSMRSLWSLSGAKSRARFKVFSMQMEALGHLCKELDGFGWLKGGSARLRTSVHSTLEAGREFAQAREKGEIMDLATLNSPEAGDIRKVFRECAEIVTEDLLLPGWREEHSPIDVAEPGAEGKPVEQKLKLSENLPLRAGEEFICLIYVGYLQNLLGRMRTMVMSVAGLFAAIALAVGFYPFTPRPTISLSLLLLLLVIGTAVGVVFAGLDRDSTLSRITNTQPGSLGTHFWIRMLSFIGVPALGLIVAQFPEITGFVFSWIAPTMSAVK